ncbi:MAG: hypothetical protein LBU98_03635, partial [Alistipes sp.]|nr:hypothetical protein [Alistipes sp.]
MKNIGFLTAAAVAALLFSGCQKDNGGPDPQPRPELGEEWYPGWLMGTSFDATSNAYKQAMPAVDEDPALFRQFMRGEQLFVKSFVANEGTAYSGLGPAYIRKSCIACHPSYGGRSKRVETFDTQDSRNGYLLMIYDPSQP